MRVWGDPIRRHLAGVTRMACVGSLGHRVADHDILPAVWVLGPGSELVAHPSPGNGVVRVDPGPELGGG